MRTAVVNGHQAIGQDLDPLAVLMSKVWTTPIDVEVLKEAASEIVTHARSFREDDLIIPWIDSDPKTLEFIKFWFAQPQEIDLRRLMKAILESGKETVIENA